jgi:hypothetical protein
LSVAKKSKERGSRALTIPPMLARANEVIE